MVKSPLKHAGIFDSKTLLDQEVIFESNLEDNAFQYIWHKIKSLLGYGSAGGEKS